MSATLCHVTWHARDLQRTRTFLESLFGWTFDATDPTYLIARPASGAWIGLTNSPLAGATAAFLPQISVSDIDATCATAASLDPHAVVERGALPNVGLYADLRDPDGAVFSVIQFGA